MFEWIIRRLSSHQVKPLFYGLHSGICRRLNFWRFAKLWPRFPQNLLINPTKQWFFAQCASWVNEFFIFKIHGLIFVKYFYRCSNKMKRFGIFFCIVLNVSVIFPWKLIFFHKNLVLITEWNKKIEIFYCIIFVINFKLIKNIKKEN